MVSKTQNQSPSVSKMPAIRFGNRLGVLSQTKDANEQIESALSYRQQLLLKTTFKKG